MVYNTVLTAEKRGPQIAGAQIAGVYCTIILNEIVIEIRPKKIVFLDKTYKFSIIISLDRFSSC